ncbi:pyruvate kinase [Neobacillus ginsengisoli]|uniref:Pyruvate kinase n=1 Tax=Neobacillus ginsengisoli TaxID=904295 RepID=A0ABT9XZ10_9BACI|nr:pyruvate kinase [Neobacillus ginsengisoli]MDQ0200798.1 pyruvate kinase [Neobacillus ginsengisoli]
MSIDRVCTIGPASSDKNVLTELMNHGMTIARLNFSHGTHESHGNVIRLIKTLSEERGQQIKIVGDLQGPKIRLGKVEGDKVALKTGQTFTLLIDEVRGNENQVSVDYEGIVKDVKPDDRILLNDGAVELVVTEVDETKVVTTVKAAGEISSHKGVNLPGVVTGLPAITEKDKQDIQFLIQEEIDFIACSFVRRAAHIKEVRNFMNRPEGHASKLVAKIETIEAIQNFQEICRETDAVMIARGDLGVELPYHWIPLLQKAMISECNRTRTYVITATQMLQSMVENPLPTRAEVTDVFQAVIDGTNAVMLSAESAAGHYPVQSIETLKLVSQFAETVRKEAPFDFADMLKLLNQTEKSQCK